MNKKILFISLAALLLGFLLAWFIKPNLTKEQYEHSNSEIIDQKQIWTCSMHPQIRQNEPGDCPICGMDLIPLDESGSEGSYFEMTEEAVQLANIQTLKISTTENFVISELFLNGKIEVDETRASSLVAHIPGRIEDLFIRFTGDYVSKGAKIASVYSPELITAQKELIEVEKLKDLSPSLLQAAKNKLKFWKISEADIQSILESGKIREQFNIYADHSGTVINKKIQVGDYINTGQVLFDIQNLDKVWVQFEVYESDLENIDLGDDVTFTTSSLPGQTFHSNISFIDPVVNPSTRIVKVRAEIDNRGNKLKPQMFVQGQIGGVEKNVDSILIPRSSVLWTGTRSVVYIKVSDIDIPSFEYREIVLGKMIGDNYIIKEGLKPGEEIVVNGAFMIDAAAQLNNQVSMMNKNVMVKNAIHSEYLPDYTSTTPQKFKEQLTTLVSTYLLLKDALVESNKEKAVESANDVLSELANVDMTLVSDKAHFYWMEQLEAIQTHSKKITEQEDLEKQRKQFDFLSQSLIKSIKVFGVTSTTFFVQHCPMVNDNDGADWLSKHQKILNPYFGDQMLTCGTVQDTIDVNFNNPPMQEQSNVQINIHNH